MKQLVRQRFLSNKKKLQTLHKHMTATSSPVDHKYIINGDIFGERTNKLYLNPYMKKFNVRKINRTQQSKTISREKSKNKLSPSNEKLQKLIKQPKKKQEFKLNNLISKQIHHKQHQKLPFSLDMKRKKPKIISLQKQYLSFLKKQEKSPHFDKKKLRTMDDELQTNKSSMLSNKLPHQKQSKFSYMTNFQLEEIEKYEIYYPGQRRIHSIKYFTDNEGNVKISIGDSIAYRYEIKSLLGQGSFGQVYRSFDHKKKEQVALKIIKNHPKFNKQAKIEIKILETVLLHDYNSEYNIIKLKHAFIFRGHSCLVFQLLHINLYEFLRMNNFKGLPLDLIRRIAIQILKGLLFFQKFDIVHCDLKPENILLRQQNKTGIKIIDVGSGTFQQDQIYTYIQSRFYRAPEIILGVRYNAKIDIWSFGCILCELYFGSPIFPGENQQQQILMLMEALGLPPHELIDRGSRSNKFFDQYQPKIIPNSKGKIRTPSTKTLSKKFRNCDDLKFVQFIQRCFKWLPEERFRPDEALLDQWILNGLPPQIRQKHTDMVKLQKSSFLRQ